MNLPSSGFGLADIQNAFASDIQNNAKSEEAESKLPEQLPVPNLPSPEATEPAELAQVKLLSLPFLTKL